MLFKIIPFLFMLFLLGHQSLAVEGDKDKKSVTSASLTNVADTKTQSAEEEFDTEEKITNLIDRLLYCNKYALPDVNRFLETLETNLANDDLEILETFSAVTLYECEAIIKYHDPRKWSDREQELWSKWKNVHKAFALRVEKLKKDKPVVNAKQPLQVVKDMPPENILQNWGTVRDFMMSENPENVYYLFRRKYRLAQLKEEQRPEIFSKWMELRDISLCRKNGLPVDDQIKRAFPTTITSTDSKGDQKGIEASSNTTREVATQVVVQKVSCQPGAIGKSSGKNVEINYDDFY